MAYPANIAPGTDPTPYDIVGIDNDPLFVLLDGFTYETVVGAQSRARVDLPFYNGSTTRDTVDAAKLGRGGVSVIRTDLNTGALGTNLVSTTPFNGDIVIDVNTKDGDTPATSTVIPDEILTMMQQDDNFTHTAPHQNVLAKTVIRYYNGPNGTGDVVGEFVDAQWVGEGSKIPQTYGSVPPTYTP